MKPIVIVALALLLFAANATAAPPAYCGMTVTSDVTLHSDLECSSGHVGLDVVADDVTIDLNGHTLSRVRKPGDTEYAVGIALHGVASVDIRNGAIKGFNLGIQGNRAFKTYIQQVLFSDLNAGVDMHRSRYTSIRDSIFYMIDAHGISLRSGPATAGASGNHSIVDNDLGWLDTGILLCGYDESNSVIRGNEIVELTGGAAIALVDGSHGNRIEHNQVRVGPVSTGIHLSGSNDNLVQSNDVRNGRVGYQLTPYYQNQCDTGGAPVEPDVKGNSILSNYGIGFETAVWVGLPTGTGGIAHANKIQGNKLYDNQVGIRFDENAHANDGTGNGYQGTIQPVIDDGIDNSY